MGAEPWEYFIPYEENLQAALEKLRRREFEAGRFYPSEEKPATIEEAIDLTDGCGTQSILDMERIRDTPGISVIVPLSTADLMRFFGTDRPTHETVEDNMEEFYEEIERGEGVAIIVYKDDRPSEIFFGGYSVD